MKKLLFILATFIFAVGCADNNELVFEEKASTNPPASKFKLIKASDPVAAPWVAGLEKRLHDDPFLKARDEKTRIIFYESLLFNQYGEVLSFVLDYEELSVKEDEFDKFVYNVLDATDMRFVTEETFKLPSLDELAKMSSYPPQTYRRKRNNDVGGCDKYWGSICVIRFDQLAMLHYAY